MSQETKEILESATTTTESDSHHYGGTVDNQLDYMIKDKQQDEFGLFEPTLFEMPRIFDDGNYIVGEPENFGMDDGIMSATSPTASATSGSGSFEPPSPFNYTNMAQDDEEEEIATNKEYNEVKYIFILR